MAQKTSECVIKQVFHDQPQLLKAAAEEFGLDWGKLFRSLCTPHRQAFVLWEGTPVGLCLVSVPGRVGLHVRIRRLVCATEGSAALIIRYLQEALATHQSRLYWDVPERSLARQKLAQRLGGFCQRIVYRKRDGEAVYRFVWEPIPPF